MKWIRKLKDRIKGLTDAIARFPLTTMFLLAAAITDAYGISTEKDILKFLFPLAVGAFLSAVAQAAHERYFTKTAARFVLMGIVVLLTAGYYLIIRPAPKLSMEIEIRTAVALFAVLIGFIWVPTIKSKTSFNQSFMITFKSFFNSLFFSAVIYGGISIILAAFDQLIFRINTDAYPHTANIIFIIFAPMYFLSLIPVYPGANAKTPAKKIDDAAHCPKFLEVLISYIIIPLIAVFTLILVIYIVKNIGGRFWQDNLLEPMLVSYSITVILTYILASDLENKFTILFRKIFPKVLVPIVLFQIASSILSLADTGVTHTRYYAILFGIFAAAAGVLLSFLPVRKNGVIAALLIVFAAVSIVPPVDAFTVSRNSQTNTLKNVLMKNNMLADNQIHPNGSISKKDQKTITYTVNYLSMMEYTKKIAWFPKDFKVYDDFKKTFGFEEYQQPAVNMNQGVYLGLKQPAPMKITGYDLFVQTDIYGKGGNETVCDFEKAGKTYTLRKDPANGQITVYGKKDEKLITFKMKEIYNRFASYQSMKQTISVQEATFTKENSRAKITIVVQNVAVENQNPENNNALLNLFVGIK